MKLGLRLLVVGFVFVLLPGVKVEIAPEARIRFEGARIRKT